MPLLSIGEFAYIRHLSCGLRNRVGGYRNNPGFLVDVLAQPGLFRGSIMPKSLKSRTSTSREATRPTSIAAHINHTFGACCLHRSSSCQIIAKV